MLLRVEAPSAKGGVSSSEVVEAADDFVKPRLWLEPQAGAIQLHTPSVACRVSEELVEALTEG
jgi:hypothetical protein